MQLTLNDFDCKDPPPKWLPQEKWEDILALSVLPGPLDSLCVHMAQNSDTWKSWYTSDYPEREPLPVASAGGEEGKGSLLWTEFVKLHCFSVNLEKDSDLQGMTLIIIIGLHGTFMIILQTNVHHLVEVGTVKVTAWRPLTLGLFLTSISCCYCACLDKTVCQQHWSAMSTNTLPLTSQSKPTSSKQSSVFAFFLI